MKRFFKFASKILVFSTMLLITMLSSCGCEHEWVVDSSTSTATCTEDGEVAYHCTVCNAEKWEKQEKGHVYSITEAIEPTCTRDGLTEGKKCTVCSEVFLKSERVAAPGHTYDGIYDEKCNTCGLYKKANVAFMHGLAPKSAGIDQIGYINTAGEYVISPKFSSAAPFNESGYAVVRYRGQDAVIDTKGNYVVEPGEWEISGAFNEQGFLQIEADDGLYLVNTEFEKVHKLKNGIKYWGLSDNGYAIVEINDKYFIQHVSGEIKPIYLDYKEYTVDQFAPNGLAAFRVRDAYDDQYGFINEQGEVVIEPQFYRRADSFSRSGFALVSVRKDNDFLYGYINEQGEVIYPIELGYGYSFGEDGLAFVCFADETSGFINTAGEIVVKGDFKTFEEVRFSSNGLCPVRISTKGSGYIDKSGNMVIEPIYKETYGFAENGLARVVTKARKTVYINENGETVIELDCLYAFDFTDDGYAFYYVQVGGKNDQEQHMIDSSGNLIF